MSIRLRYYFNITVILLVLISIEALHIYVCSDGDNFAIKYVFSSLLFIPLLLSTAFFSLGFLPTCVIKHCSVKWKYQTLVFESIYKRAKYTVRYYSDVYEPITKEQLDNYVKNSMQSITCSTEDMKIHVKRLVSLMIIHMLIKKKKLMDDSIKEYLTLYPEEYTLIRMVYMKENRDD